jgi:hypothetical protein
VLLESPYQKKSKVSGPRDVCGVSVFSFISRVLVQCHESVGQSDRENMHAERETPMRSGLHFFFSPSLSPFPPTYVLSKKRDHDDDVFAMWQEGSTHGVVYMFRGHERPSNPIHHFFSCVSSVTCTSQFHANSRTHLPPHRTCNSLAIEPEGGLGEFSMGRRHRGTTRLRSISYTSRLF